MSDNFILQENVGLGNAPKRWGDNCQYDVNGNLKIEVTLNYGSKGLAYCAALSGQKLGTGIQTTLKAAMRQAVDELLADIGEGAK